MKKNLLLFTCLFACLSLSARGPWTEYTESVPSQDTPAAVATDYVKLANTRDFDGCRELMTADYEAWLERLGGVESQLHAFVDADLDRRFGWRELVEGEKATVWVRIFVVEKNREVNVALNLIRSGNQWKLTI